jgi:FkbM family methyltransferase
MKYAQYGEESIILDFFGQDSKGTVVDVGAADGIRYSNSRYLIELGWFGVLVEPHPTYFDKINELYKDTDSVTTINAAVYSEEGEMPFYVYGRDEHAQVSTLSKEFKERVVKVHGNKFEEHPTMVRVIKLSTVLQDAGKVDFLSIDCEGVDMEVIKSNDWDLYRPTLVCVEHSMPKSELHEFMNSVNYTFLTETQGNTFFKDNLS